ncbi:MAG: hypothetical protein DMF79_14540 [Acidobacteria bacterium]|nr:MAG: hypothetical protein DMF79_14540 [Acidobacteriota bacterium]
MGLEAACRARYGKKASEGKAQLETTDLLFRGAFRLQIPLRDVTSVEAKSGELVVVWPEGEAAFALGKDAEKWALKVRYPRGLLDKLGVKRGARVAVVGDLPGDFLKDLGGRTDDVTRGRPKKDTDLVFVAMADPKDLGRLAALRAAIKPEGGIWVVWPKGRRAFREDDVRAAGPGAGLVDVKVVSFSDTLSGLKMVIPVTLRKVRR